MKISKKFRLKPVGKTIDGKLVVVGVFKLYDSVLGIPLSDIIDELWKNNIVIDWYEFIVSARTSKMPDKSIKHLMSTAFADSINYKNALSAVSIFFN